MNIYTYISRKKLLISVCLSMHLYYAHHSIGAPSLETFWGLAIIKMSVDIGWQNSLRLQEENIPGPCLILRADLSFPLLLVIFLDLEKTKRSLPQPKLPAEAL